MRDAYVNGDIRRAYVIFLDVHVYESRVKSYAVRTWAISNSVCGQLQ